QKELFHNEALQMLDTIVAAAVESALLNEPPATPVPGQCFIVGTAPTGIWAGHAASLASFSQAGWRFIEPADGLQAWLKSTSTWAAYRAGAWELGTLRATRLMIDGVNVVGARGPAVPDPAGGTTVDGEARSAIAAILTAMRTHGLIATE
nr:DUF2793 domain-containing protein [Sphingomonas sp.]